MSALRKGERLIRVATLRCALAGPGPYTARSASDNTDDCPFWYVAGPDGRRNVLRFPDMPGRTLTARSLAETIAAAANSEDQP